VGLDFDLQQPGQRLVCLQASDPAQVGSEILVGAPHPDWRAVWLDLPAASCAVYGPAP
jgi:hypothetical protein